MAPHITSDGAGGAIVTWADYRGTSPNIYAQRIDASGTVQWTTDGVPLSTASGGEEKPRITSDGAGGAIVTWSSYRAGNSDIYAQRMDASGTVQWTADGVALCTATGHQRLPKIISDGAGGAIVTWYDERSGNDDVYAQRINASGTVQWSADGVPLCTATGDQATPQITSDGAGGAIVTWHDHRIGVWDVYAQRIDASGTVQWTTDGVPLCTASGDQWEPQVTSDGAGGAIVTWRDDRVALNHYIYAQRIDASGTVQWTADGVQLCMATGDQWDPQIISGGAGGAIVTWQDFRSGDYDIYAQLVNSTGTVQWTTDGVPLCTATDNQRYPEITSDGASGAIVTWRDERNSDYDIYAQQIDSQGRVGYLPPVIDSVSDVPGDEGGRVRIAINSTTWDHEQWYSHPVSLYNVWQRVDDPALIAMIDQGAGDGATIEEMSESSPGHSTDASSVSAWPAIEWNDRYFVQSNELLQAVQFPPGTWELLGSFAACQHQEYIYRASTLADSTGAGIPYSVYMVSVHTTTPSIWYTSEPDSGYSVDNLPPQPPEALVAEQSSVPVGLSLDWEVNVENDFSYYAVYRDSSEDFMPAPGNRIATPVDPEYFDDEWRWNAGYYYKVSATDIHGNESDFVLLTPENVTGADTPGRPRASYLRQNFPNPFNPSTTIEFGLERPARVSLMVYDAAGRLVHVIADDDRPAGHYAEVWDGKDASSRAVSSGVYFYRLDTGSLTKTKKMILIK
jgi:predicted lipoprotein with Yx(FWY)xxD motif